MKRIVQVLIFSCFISWNLYPQGNNLGYFKENGSSSALREGELECAPGSIFSQAPPNLWSAWFCDANDPGQYTEIIDDYPALSGNIQKITCWMGFYHRIYGNCIPVSPQTDSYQVSFYNIDNPDPAYPGTLAQSFMLNPTLVQYLGSMMNDYYRVEFTLPVSVSISPGWVGISRLTRQDECILMWYIILPGGNQVMGVQRHAGVLENAGTEFSFCLEAGVPEEVPVSPWALLISIGLIISLLIFRYHKAGAF